MKKNRYAIATLILAFAFSLSAFVLSAFAQTPEIVIPTDTSTSANPVVNPVNQNNFGPAPEEVEKANRNCNGNVIWEGTAWRCGSQPQNYQGTNGGSGSNNQCGPDGCPGPQNNPPYQGNNFQDPGQGNFGQENPKELERQKKQFSKDMGQVQTVKTIKSLIKKLPVGYSASPELTDALAKVDKINADAQAATDFDTINDLRQDLNDALDTLRQGEQSLRMISDMQRMDKQATNELTKITKKLNQLEAKAIKSKIDVSNLVQAARSTIDTATATLQKARDTGKSGNVDDAQSAYQDFFEGIGDLWQSVGAIEAVQQISRGIGSVEKKIKSGRDQITKLAKRNPDADLSEALDLVQQASDKVAELKNSMKSGDFQPEDAMSFFEDLNDLRQEIENVVTEALDGQRINLQFFSAQGMSKMPDFGPKVGPGNDMPRGSAPSGPGFGGPGDFGPGPGSNFGPGPGSNFGPGPGSFQY